MFALSLGPVQDFIVASRRTRDLWFGSYLLSQASLAAAQALRAQGAQLIFPAAETLDAGEDARGNVSNKILAVVTASEEDLRVLAQRAVQAARDAVLALARNAFSHGPLDRPDDRATLQLEDLLECYWAAAELTAGYAQARQQAERALAARKNTRDFAPVTWGAGVPKSALDGQRESVTYQRLSEGARTRAGIGVGEELCAPGLVKRLGLRGEVAEQRFMSTSHVAAQPYLARLGLADPDAVRRDWDRYLAVLEDVGVSSDLVHPRVGGDRVLGRHDGRMLYGSRLRELVEGQPDAAAAERRAQEALDRFLRAHPAATPVFGTVPPDPYYAVFQADGDSMGSLIDREAARGPDRHAALSRALSAFAGQAGRIVRDAQGSLIYAGGDDVLALLPLHTALACAAALAGSYRQHLGDFGEDATLSGGLVIAHFLTPLQDTLRAVRQTEKRAKDVPGKNALAVTLRRRSGAPLHVRGHWGALDRQLQTLSGFFLQDALPGKLAYDVRVLARDLGASAPAGLAAAELERVLARKKAERGAAWLTKDVSGTLTALLTAEGGVTDVVERAPAREHLPLRSLSDQLIVAQVFARAQAQAGLMPPATTAQEAS
ncbi:type III-B CRISPR-associated protein Cas10/Cmr2 [Deinococcus aquiradiocola]|uniref:type III-B CRISPR-associated protein Cas10/Cmr2 n=1 Tax=Deinococcus aquiradiocola TaxID=393059 RepID=UPI001E57A9E8|nr:type III-B CRISPR-associated protein Cas10/Cmr2 [Deinococcus aquiradiocola]